MISETDNIAKSFMSLVRGNIVQQEVDAVATLIPQNFDFKGGINDSLAEAAGYDVDAFILENIYKPQPMDVYALPGGDLSAQHIFVGIMPYYRTDFDLQERDLINIARQIMDLSRCMLVKRLAFPPIGSSRKLFPKRKAARLLIKGVSERMHNSIKEVRFVCQDEKSHMAFEETLNLPD